MLADLRSFLASPSRTRAEAFGLGIGKELRGWEVIVADDGSRDETAEVGGGRDWDGKEGGNEKELGRGEIRVVRLEKNRGKGGAVKHVSVSHFATVRNPPEGKERVSTISEAFPKLTPLYSPRVSFTPEALVSSSPTQMEHLPFPLSPNSKPTSTISRSLSRRLPLSAILPLPQRPQPL
jgi:hypothetical protein